jgi:nitrile hydratase accessory protein
MSMLSAEQPPMHDKTSTPAALDDALLQDDTRPGFAEPWQAELFAMTHALSQRGVFSWPQWAAAFATAIARHPQTGEEGIELAYFRQWLSALEGLLADKGICAAQDLNSLAARWRQAYLHTPHGQPVELVNAEHACAHVSHASPRGVPIAVSAAAQPR